jgi:hypothetical protein
MDVGSDTTLVVRWETVINDIGFWKDKWLGPEPLRYRFAALFNQVFTTRLFYIDDGLLGG